MGNCLNAMTPMSSTSCDPSLPIPSSPYPPFSAAEMPSHPKSSLVPFVPILPFSTRSNLGTLYFLGPELGRGQFGIIHSCTNRASGALLACKSISKLRLRTTRDVEDVVREVSIMKNLSEPLPSHACRTRSTANSICPHSDLPSSIVRLHDVIEDKAFVHLIMELCSGGELFNRINVKKKCYDEDQAACIMKSLLETVQFCHSKGIMHRDIKPENVLLVEDCDTSDIKLADFGLALEFSPGQKFSGMAGSSYYIAPEVLQGEYSQEIDMWSAGVILYMLLSGVPPFWGATEQRIFKAIQKGDLNFPHDTWYKISSSAKEMITQMLHPDAKLRLTPAQALKHPWIVHHTRNAKKTQLNSASDTLPSSASLPEHKHAANLGSLTSTFTNTHNQSMSGAELCNTAKTELNKFFVDLIAGVDSHPFSKSTSLAGKRLQQSAGTTSCTLLSLNGTGETLVVDMGKEKYLVSHDRIKRMIGWRLLKEKPASSNMNSFHQFQQEVCAQERRLQGGKLNTTARLQGEKLKCLDVVESKP